MRSSVSKSCRRIVWPFNVITSPSNTKLREVSSAICVLDVLKDLSLSLLYIFRFSAHATLHTVSYCIFKLVFACNVCVVTDVVLPLGEGWKQIQISNTFKHAYAFCKDWLKAMLRLRTEISLDCRLSEVMQFW